MAQTASGRCLINARDKPPNLENREGRAHPRPFCLGQQARRLNPLKERHLSGDYPLCTSYQILKRKSQSNRAFMQFFAGAKLGWAARLSIASALTYRLEAINLLRTGLTENGLLPDTSGFSQIANERRISKSLCRRIKRSSPHSSFLVPLC